MLRLWRMGTYPIRNINRRIFGISLAASRCTCTRERLNLLLEHLSFQKKSKLGLCSVSQILWFYHKFRHCTWHSNKLSWIVLDIPISRHRDVVVAARGSGHHDQISIDAVHQ